MKLIESMYLYKVVHAYFVLHQIVVSKSKPKKWFDILKITF